MTEEVIVIGAGMMGVDIATALMESSYEVTLVDARPLALEAAVAGIAKRLPDLVAKLKIAHLSAVTGEPTAVIEAITESLDAKRELLGAASVQIAQDVPIFSNTSTLSIEALSTAVRAPERFAGLHFFFPAHRNKFLEIVAARHTEPQTVSAAVSLAKRMRKQHVVCADRPGFVVNAFYLPLVNEAVRLVDAKIASPAQVDAIAMNTFGVRLGPLAVTKMMNPQTTKSTLASLVAQGACPAAAPSIVSVAASEFDLVDAGELTEEVTHRVRDRLLASVFLPCLRMLEDEDAEPAAIDLAATQALKFSIAPIALMNELGAIEVQRVVQTSLTDWGVPLPAVAARAGSFPVTSEST
jgi:3-hydroxyacyl-CoA dehydrogenase